MPEQDSTLSELDEATAPDDPMTLFRSWYQHAVEAGAELANAMALATVAQKGQPSVRYVLLKGFDEQGFVFFTNRESRKGSELEANPRVAAAILWSKPRRQVRIEGRVAAVSTEESDAYFRTRDRMSQLGAWASPQSEVLNNRGQLEERLSEFEERFRNREVPRPSFWGGYRIVHDVVEFWSGRDHRLHDRIRYRSRADGGWIVERIAP